MGKSALTGNATINTLNRKLLVSSKYSEMGLIVPTRRLFGLGQRNGKFKLDSGSYTMLSRGRKEYLPAEDYLGGK
jgi:alpha-glucosidase (family GH31 glycosyl hydrolase)